MKKLFFILCLVVPAIVMAQSIKITGVIIDKETQKPVIGANVLVSGTQSGTITDLNGQFELMASIDAILEISYLGYRTKEERVVSEKYLRIEIEEDITMLNQVVIVGMSVSKKDLTGAVSSVSAKQMKEVPALSINQAIQGKMTGVRVTMSDPRPGGATTIKIRGSNSIRYGMNPIYVVDGLVLEEGFDLINPNDIESVNVLKDASATALYGSRGANGVVLITTKKGSGQGRVSYDGWAGVQRYTNRIPTMNTQGLYQLREDAAANYLSNKPENAGISRSDIIKNIVHAPDNPYFADYEYEAYQKGETSNWLKPVTQDGFQQSHNVSFSGSSDKGMYYVSFNYVDQKGLIKSTGYKKYSGKVNLEQNIKPWLKIGTNTSYIRSEEDLVDSSVYSTAQNANPMYAVNDEENVLWWGKTKDLDAPNPIKSLTIDWDKHTNRTISTNFIQITPMKDLVFRSTFGIDVYNTQEAYYRPKSTYQGVRNDQDGEASQRKDEYLNWQWDNSLSYKAIFNEDHALNVMLGHSMSKNRWQYNNSVGWGFPVDEFSYHYLDAASGNKYLYSNTTTNTLASFIGRVNYEYKNKYILTASGRYDGSSKFGKGEKWGFFPSVAAAWVISEENFMKELYPFDNLKLRAGYGMVGNQNVPLYMYMNRYYPDGSSGGNTFKLDPTMGNPMMSWEKQKQFNLGLDVAILNNRLNFTIDYFNIVNDNLLMPRTLSPSSGFTQVIENVGKLENKGIEVSMGARIIETKDWAWNINASFSKDENKVVELFGNVDAIYNIPDKNTGVISRTGNYFVGESINTVYSYKFKKICQEEDMEWVSKIDYQGRTIQPGDLIPEDINDDKIIDDRDRVVVGKLDPDFFGGFSSDLSYKNFALNAVFNYSVGGKRISTMYERMMSGTGLSVAHKDMRNRWTPENTDTNIPRAYYSQGERYQMSQVDWGLQSASFLKMTALTLSYSFPKDFIQKIHVDNLRLYFTGSNLLTFSSYKGYDPEWGDAYPAYKMYVVGINFSF